jgi:hypothetical protein
MSPRSFLALSFAIGILVVAGDAAIFDPPRLGEADEAAVAKAPFVEQPREPEPPPARRLQTAREATGERVPPSYERPPLLESLSANRPPPRPAWQIVEAFRRSGAPTPSEEDKVFYALSYCANVAAAPRMLREMRAHGQAAGPASDALERHVRDSVVVCSRLGPGEYVLRSTIAKRRADAGDVEAMLTHFEVGPGGAGASLERNAVSIEVHQAWLRESITYLEIAMGRGKLKALSTLAAIYRAAAEKEDQPFAWDGADPVTAYAYALALSQVRSKDISLSMAEKGTIAAETSRLQKNLSALQQMEAEKHASGILDTCCKE